MSQRIDLDHGRFRQICLNTKLDAPLPAPGADLDGFYRGRRWLMAWLNDPSHQVTFRLEPGDVVLLPTPAGVEELEVLEVAYVPLDTHLPPSHTQLSPPPAANTPAA